MDLFFVGVLALLRPIAFIESHVKIMGLNLFELFAALSFVVLLLVFMARLTVTRRFDVSATDLLIAGFTLWCVAAYVIYLGKAHLSDLARFLMPLVTYTVVKNIVHSRDRHRQILFLMICGFTIPVLWTVWEILHGQGVSYISYFTRLPRYQGVYSNSHNLGHNMTFLLMLTTIYYVISTTGPAAEKSINSGLGSAKLAFLLVLAVLGTYCLYNSYVRTAIIGAAAFGFLYLFFLNRKLWLGAVVGIAVAGVALAPLVATVFYDVAEVAAGERSLERVGSGRPEIWESNIEKFSDLELDRKLAGVGIGNRGLAQSDEGVRNSHNDFLDVLMQTGIVGLILFVGIQAALLLAILRMNGRERYAFLSLFIAVLVMNFVSNSYFSRFGVAQMFYMLMVYVELPGGNQVEIMREKTGVQPQVSPRK